MAGQARSKRSPADAWLLAIGSLAAVVAVVATLDAVAVRAAAARQSRSGPERWAAEDSDSGGGVWTLAGFTPVAGGKYREQDEDDLHLLCPTSGTGSASRQVSYQVPAGLDLLSSAMTVAGTADPASTATLEVLVRRPDEQDRPVTVEGPITLPQGGSLAFAAPLGDADRLTLRVTCQEGTQRVVLTVPVLTRVPGGVPRAGRVRPTSPG